jgi:hypothetical protein
MSDLSRKGFGRRPEIFSPPPSFIAMVGPEPGQWFTTALAGMRTPADVLAWLRNAFDPVPPEETEGSDAVDTVVWQDDRVAAVVFNYGRPDEKVVINPYVPQAEKGADR